MMRYLMILGGIIFLLNAGIYTKLFLNMQTQSSVLGAEVDHRPAPTATPRPVVSDSPTPTLAVTPTSSPSAARMLSKSTYSIAAFGDSMVDTMGENLEYLQKALATRYPNTQFKLYNYGIGGQNVSMGLARFGSSFDNRERHFPPISQIKADVIIIGSFAYNPFSPHDRNKHYSELTALVQKAQATTATVYMLSEISPRDPGFGKGPHGVNWPEDISHEHALKIIEQLENAQSIAHTLHVPLIDATTPSRVHGKFGEINYVNPDDGIHPSVAGHIFTAGIIAQTVKLK